MGWEFNKDRNAIEFHDSVDISLGLPRGKSEQSSTSSGIGQIDACIVANNHLNDFYLTEWSEIRVKVRKKVGELTDLKILFGQQEAEKYDEQSGLYRHTYKNQIGKSKVSFASKTISIPDLNIEVLSKKLTLNEADTSKLYYPEFYSQLVNDLFKKTSTLPFSINSPTYLSTRIISQTPTDFFVYWFFCQKGGALMSAFETILRDPYRVLVEHDEFVPFHEVTEIDTDSILNIFSNSQYLSENNGGIAIADKLKSKVTGKKYVPTNVFQHINEETFDTLENRFIKYFLNNLLNSIELLKKNYNFSKLFESEETRRTIGYLNLIRHDSFFNEISDMTYFPSQSQVLQKRDGYKELLALYNEYISSKSPLFDDIQNPIDSRNIADLYEYWCFFELTDQLKDVFDSHQADIEIKVNNEFGLQDNLKVAFDNFELHYNRMFSSGANKSNFKSYSVNLKPDFTLINKTTGEKLVFDAKFRFDIEDFNSEDSSGSETGELKNNNDIERLAKKADIYKMHTYKDALDAKAAIILYPGTDRSNIFYDKTYIPAKDRLDLTDVISLIYNKASAKKKVNPSELNLSGGVGALSFVPGENE